MAKITTLLLFSLLYFDNPCGSSLEKGFLLIKSFDVQPKGDYYELSYVFTKGTSYNLDLCPVESFEKLEIYNNARVKMIETKDQTVLRSSIFFPCAQTGIYYIRIYNGSGAATLSFKRS